MIRVGEVLYDMRSPRSGLLSFPMLLFLLAIAVVMVIGLVRKEPKAQRDSLLGKGRFVPMLAFIGIALGAALLPQSLRPWAAAADKKATALEGCVTNFQRVVHPNGHNITDTYFTVQGVDFHFNSSPWLPGFHNEDDIVRPGDGLRITRVNNTVLRIERAPQWCGSQRPSP